MKFQGVKFLRADREVSQNNLPFVPGPRAIEFAATHPSNSSARVVSGRRCVGSSSYNSKLWWSIR
jgi:hypothetical protein